MAAGSELVGAARGHAASRDDARTSDSIAEDGLYG
jgi:hypothetical protein